MQAKQLRLDLMEQGEDLPLECVRDLERLARLASGEEELTEDEERELLAIFEKGELLGPEASAQDRIDASQADMEAFAKRTAERYLLAESEAADALAAAAGEGDGEEVAEEDTHEEEEEKVDDLLADERSRVSKDGTLLEAEEDPEYMLNEEYRRRRQSEVTAARLDVMGQPPNVPSRDSAAHKFEDQQLIARGRSLFHSKGLTGGYGQVNVVTGGGGVGGSASGGGVGGARAFGRGGGTNLSKGSGRGGGRGGGGIGGIGGASEGNEITLEPLGAMGLEDSSAAYEDTPTSFFDDASEEANASVLRLLHDVHIHKGTDAYTAGVAKAQYELTPCAPTIAEDHEHYAAVAEMCETMEKNPHLDADYKRELVAMYQEQLSLPPMELDEHGLPPYTGVMPNAKTYAKGAKEPHV